MFEKIKRYYELGYYKKIHIDKLYEMEKLTKEQYDEILAENQGI